MGTFADSLFAVLMSWVRALVNSLWALFSSERTTVLEFLGKNWLLIVIVFVAAGLFIDWIIWLIRWKPYTLWAQRARKILRISSQDDEPRDKAQKEEIAAYSDYCAEDGLIDGDANEDDVIYDDDEEDWLPEQPVFIEEEAQEAIARAQAVPDEELGVYPGMRYDEQARPAQEELGGTRRFGAVTQEGPGAAEVSRRREEIDAYKQQLEEQARLERERRMEAMRRAQQERLAEEARRAQEAKQAEEARLAQEEYERQLAEYERQKAQYELELAQYQRDMAAYEAAVAAQNADVETAQELAPQTGRTRARRKAATYSDMVQGETVEALPESPQWPKMEETVSQVKKSAPKSARSGKNGFAQRMAHLIEPEKEEVSGVHALPPRVDPKTAYNPAAKPEEARKKRRK